MLGACLNNLSKTVGKRMCFCDLSIFLKFKEQNGINEEKNDIILLYIFGAVTRM